MRVYSSNIPVETRKRIELINITPEVKKVVREAKVKNGVVNVFSGHTTLGLYINEDEPNLRRDVENLMEKLAPVDGEYHHNRIDDNAHAHLRSILLSPFLTIPIVEGELTLGTWQSIFCAEFDGPRRRNITVQVIGE